MAKKTPAPETREKRAKRLEQEAAVAALHVMQTYPGAGIDPDDEDRARADARARRYGMRPLKPPPGEIAVRRATAGELALAKERRLGITGATGPFLDHFE